MGSVSSLRKAASHLIYSIEGLSVIVTEEGGPVADAWKKKVCGLAYGSLAPIRENGERNCSTHANIATQKSPATDH